MLVDLAIETARRALGEFDYNVIASDALEFDDPHFIQWRSPIPLCGKQFRRLSMLLTGIFGPTSAIKRLAAEADLIVAVGGAYLRGGNRVEALKSWGAHFGQLRLAAKYGYKSMYLPQSIGPYSGRYRAHTVALLSQVRRVYARDDRTFTEMRDAGNVDRAPDMAILKWARAKQASKQAPHGRPVFIARTLQNPRTYYALLSDVRDSGLFDWAVQSTGSANNDTPVTRTYSDTTPPPLSDVLASGHPRVVISTRLHGSLSALIAGFPTIHLSYERKGYSAFADLGIPEYAISARDATLAQILALVERISNDPTEYWAAMESRRAGLRAAGEGVETLMSTIAGAPEVRA